jgi:restriction endonuclease S subunit
MVKNNWNYSLLSEVCEINPGRKELQSVKGDTEVSFLPMACVSEEGKILKQEKRKLKEVIKGYTYFRDDDVLVAKITPCFENGKRAIAKNLLNGLGFGSTEFHVLRSGEKVLPRWIYYAISRDDFRNMAKSRMTGTAGQKRVPKKVLEEYEIPVPEPEEQEKISDAIEAQFTRLDAAIKSLKIIKNKLELYRHSISKVLFKGNGEYKTLENILEFKNGINFSKEQKGRGVLTVDVLNMYSQHIEVDTTNLYRVAIDLKDDYVLRDGDILFVRSSVKREGVGFATMFKSIGEPVTFCGFIIRGRIKENICPKYLIYFLRSGQARRAIVKNSSQVTITNISQANLGKISFPCPPLEEQKKIVEEIESRFSVIDKVSVVIDNSLKKAEHLRKSILKAAFEGKLVN